MMRKPIFNPSTVVVTHLPSGTIGVGKIERSQAKNRAIAMSMMRSRLYAKQHLAAGNNVIASYVLRDGEQYPEDLEQHRRHILSPK